MFVPFVTISGQFLWKVSTISEEGMVNAFGLIYAVPSYVLDHSESAAWTPRFIGASLLFGKAANQNDLSAAGKLGPHFL